MKKHLAKNIVLAAAAIAFFSPMAASDAYADRVCCEFNCTIVKYAGTRGKGQSKITWTKKDGEDRACGKSTGVVYLPTGTSAAEQDEACQEKANNYYHAKNGVGKMAVDGPYGTAPNFTYYGLRKEEIKGVSVTCPTPSATTGTTGSSDTRNTISIHTIAVEDTLVPKVTIKEIEQIGYIQ